MKRAGVQDNSFLTELWFTEDWYGIRARNLFHHVLQKRLCYILKKGRPNAFTRVYYSDLQPTTIDCFKGPRILLCDTPITFVINFYDDALHCFGPDKKTGRLDYSIRIIQVEERFKRLVVGDFYSLNTNDPIAKPFVEWITQVAIEFGEKILEYLADINDKP